MFCKNNAAGGTISIIIASFLWGTTGTAAAIMNNVSPLAIGAFSTGVGGLLLLCNANVALIYDRKRLYSQLYILLLGGLSVAMYPLAFYTSMKYSGVAIGTVISIASAPFFTVLLERFINKKHVSLQWWLSFCFGVVGIILLTLGKKTTKLEVNVAHQYWGIILGLIAGLSYAIYSWAAKQLINNGVSAKSSVASIFGVGAIILLPSLFITGDNLFTITNNLVIALYLAIVPMFLGYLLFGLGLRSMEASKATLITLLEPVIATLFAIYIIGEAFDIYGLIGMFLIAICLILQMIKPPNNI